MAHKIGSQREDFIIEKVEKFLGKSSVNWVKQEVRENTFYNGRGAPRSWKGVLGGYIYVYSDDPDLTYRGLAEQLGKPSLYTTIRKWANRIKDEYDLVKDTPGEYEEGELADCIIYPEGIEGWLCPVCGFVNLPEYLVEEEIDQCSECRSRFEFEPKLRVVEKGGKTSSNTKTETESPTEGGKL